jgi:hypothetical protein
MKWTVVWTKDAEDELAALWIAALDQGTLTAAADVIEAHLRRNPYANSESRVERARVMIESPLAVAYDLSDDDCMVTVWAVWRIS